MPSGESRVGVAVLGAAAVVLGAALAVFGAPALPFAAEEEDPDDARRASGRPVGHLRAHDGPELACDESALATGRATLVARATGWEPREGETVDAWTFDGGVPGPTLCARAGAPFALAVRNDLPETFELHVHGLPGATEGKRVAPGATVNFTVAVPADAAGVFPYHALDPDHASRGLHGVLIVRGAESPDVDHEVVMVLGEFHPELTGGRYFATMNGRAFPSVDHHRFEEGERVLVHLVNFGQEDHTLHVHGHRWFDPAEGRPIDNKFVTPHHAPRPHTDSVASFVFEPRTPGDWMIHCHIYDHINVGMIGTMTVLGEGKTTGGHEHGGDDDD